MQRTDSSSEMVDRHFLHRGTSSEFDMEVDYIRSALPPDLSPVADVGCGIGGLFERVNVARWIGVDYLVQGLQETQRRHTGVPLVCGDGTALPFRDGMLSGIVTQHVIEHIASVEPLLADWNRVLRSGGWLVILTPNKWFSDPSVYEDDTHQHIYDSRDLAYQLRRAGFLVQDIRTIGIDWFRHYERIPGGWRWRRYVLGRWKLFSRLPGIAATGQTLCATARKIG